MNWETIKGFLSSITLEKIIPVVLILAVGTLVVKLLLKLFDRMLHRSKLEKTMFTFLKTVMRILLYAVLALIAAGSLGMDVTSLVAVLSVVSLAISLAVQNTLSNVVGSVTLLTTQPFHVGDFVEIGGDSGTVEEIRMNYTLIVTPDGKRVYIPNSDAAAARICNYSAEGKRRVDMTFTASYEDDVDKVKAALRLAAKHEKAMEEPEIFVNAYLDSSIEYAVRIWVPADDYFTVKNAVTEAVKRIFDEQKISIPFPQLDVNMKK